MAISLFEQFYVEQDRNNGYSWALFAAIISGMILYGAVFHKGIQYSRLKRYERPAVYLRMVKAQKLWARINQSYRITFWGRVHYFTPSLYIGFLVYCFLNGIFSWAQTKDINYEPQSYIVGKKLSKMATGNMPVLYLFVCKNDIVTRVTGWPAHRVNTLHRQMGRTIYTMIVIHVYLCTKYWLDLGLPIMIMIPPQYFGMIAFGAMSVMMLLSPRFIRKISYEFFLFNHGLLSGIMMLLAVFHNPGGRAALLIAIHCVALDRSVAYTRALLNRFASGEVKSMGKYEILDDRTFKLTLPVRRKKMIPATRWTGPMLQVGHWKAGQHIYLRVPKIRRLQWHPFTISSISEEGEIRIIAQKFTGATKAIYQRIEKQVAEDPDEPYVHLKTVMHGPYGCQIQDLKAFDTVILISGGTGSSFTFPVAVDLMKTLETSPERSKVSRIRIIGYFQQYGNLNWYKESIDMMKELKASINVSVSVEFYVTRGEDCEKDDMTAIKEVTAPASYTSIKYGKPSSSLLIEGELCDLEEQQHIGEEFDGVSEVAVLSCGPQGLVDEISYECERQQHLKKTLNIYSYCEKYEV